MKRQSRLFFTALMFYTRIPGPFGYEYSEEESHKSIRFFPLIGWIVGGASALTFYAASLLLPPMISVPLAMISSIWLTGAFHEDGFADVCDGFGGGWTKERILEIMKDSRVGAYGVIGLVMLLLLKFGLLMTIPSQLLPFSLITAHSLSRLMATTFIFTHEYARNDESSKVKTLTSKPTLKDGVIAFLFGLIPLFLFESWQVFLLIIPLYVTKIFLARFFNKWIGGYTGDCLGATQQLCEVVFYLSLIILWKFI
ncbi:adenosylcobinamide-GDP ribazoletransferase [Xanthovirga aplysinae]|uniref:adenosylcobinamide-GDP ribazoletransferase n=1 Tax=Xanthovirga aplysinae TaxID=2529853 RepID=UPI0012BC19FD|nr:adenosylcobinamide-GDP ribazoletransferase [Xanthovirga aplysinae]MTI31005.1 adenosylcobinamide-GDP ribazoletransferase [Xanthovirga aplysinae]